jgi:hypothetical protein
MEEEEYLSPRQEELVEDLLEIVKDHGKFGWGIDSEGSHYTPASLNPFKAEGLICANCAFYAKDSKSCSIVDGVLEPEAICKFWVIENEDLGLQDFESPFDPKELNEDEEETLESSAAGKYSGISFSPPAGVKSAAKRGLALHEEGLSGGGLESATVLWARKYTRGEPVSPARARMGNRFFGRNARFARAPKDSPAWVSWLLWGGAAGRAWFARIVRQMDTADKKSSASMRGGFRLAEVVNSNPFIKELEVVLTDFEPNKNGEGIPKSEIENIIKTSKHTPIKIAASESSYGGHTGAHPVGSIVEAFVDQYDGKDVIKARAFIWKDEYPAVYDLLKSQASEGKFIGTSWEVYYTAAEEIDGVRWLKDITFAGTCIVDNPAYGDRTPLLSVAEEKEKEIMEELQKEIEQFKAAIAEKEAIVDELRGKIETYEEAERRAKAEARRNEVKSKIAAFFSESELAEKIEFYLSFEDAVLEKLVADLQKSQPVKSSSEQKETVIPEPTSSASPVNPKLLAEKLKKALKEGA